MEEVLMQACAAPMSHAELRCALTGPNTQPGGVQDGLSKRLYQPFTSSFTRKPVANEMPSSGTTATACTSGSAVSKLPYPCVQRQPQRGNQRTAHHRQPSAHLEVLEQPFGGKAVCAELFWLE